MNTQPEALVLADAIEKGNYFHEDVMYAAAELRRLHKENTALRQAIAEAEKEATLQEISDIGQEIEEFTNSTKTVAESDTCFGLQEPVAWMTNSEQDVTAEFLFSHVQTPMHKIPLYEAPSKREWVGLTDEESEDIYNAHHNTYGECITSAYDLVLDIEAKLKERNT